MLFLLLLVLLRYVKKGMHIINHSCRVALHFQPYSVFKFKQEQESWIIKSCCILSLKQHQNNLLDVFFNPSNYDLIRQRSILLRNCQSKFWVACLSKDEVSVYAQRSNMCCCRATVSSRISVPRRSFLRLQLWALCDWCWGP